MIPGTVELGRVDNISFYGIFYVICTQWVSKALWKKFQGCLLCSQIFLFHTHEMMGCSTHVLSYGHRKPLRGLTNINDARMKFMSWVRGLLLPASVCWWLRETLLDVVIQRKVVDPPDITEHSGLNQLKLQQDVKLQCLLWLTGLIIWLMTSIWFCCTAAWKLSFSLEVRQFFKAQGKRGLFSARVPGACVCKRWTASLEFLTRSWH